MSKGGDQTQTVTNEVNVPAHLQPFVNQAGSVANSALTNLSGLFGGPLVAGFNPTQQAALNQGINTSLGPNSPFNTATDFFGQVASGGVGIPGMEALSGIGGQGLPPFLQQMLAGGGQNPQLQQAFSALSGLQGANPFNQTGIDSLTATSRGDFLHGGPGFDQAVNAAVNAATPQIASAFGGKVNQGLASQAIGQVATDAFANQFGQERNRQQQASSILNQLGLQGRGQDISAANALGGLGLGAGAQGLQGAGLAANFLSGDQNRALQAALGQGSLGLSGLDQRLRAAQGLPGLALAGPQAALGFGGIQQDQAQRELMAPIQGQQSLLNTAAGGVANFSPLFGGTQTNVTSQPNDPFSSLLGAGLTGLAAFGSGGLAPGIGAAISGFFGGGGSAPLNQSLLAPPVISGFPSFGQQFAAPQFNPLSGENFFNTNRFNLQNFSL